LVGKKQPAGKDAISMKFRRIAVGLAIPVLLAVVGITAFLVAATPPLEGCYRSSLVEVLDGRSKGYIVFKDGKVFGVNLRTGDLPALSDLLGVYTAETGAVGWINYDYVPTLPGSGVRRARVDVHWLGLRWTSKEAGQGQAQRVLNPLTIRKIRDAMSSPMHKQFLRSGEG
jgi:hypothetical protein